jgi:hypothetical protein
MQLTRFIFFSTLLQYTCDSALQKAAKFETLYTEQLRISEVQCDRVTTLESENASLSNKVANFDACCCSCICYPSHTVTGR